MSGTNRPPGVRLGFDVWGAGKVNWASVLPPLTGPRLSHIPTEKVPKIPRIPAHCLYLWPSILQRPQKELT